jgi:hypothetical protein
MAVDGNQSTPKDQTSGLESPPLTCLLRLPCFELPFDPNRIPEPNGIEDAPVLVLNVDAVTETYMAFVFEHLTHKHLRIAPRPLMGSFQIRQISALTVADVHVVEQVEVEHRHAALALSNGASSFS